MATMDMAAGEDPRQEFEVDFEQSGHAHVDAALDRLLELPGQPLSDHAEVYDDIHQRLRGILADQPGGGAGGSGAGDQR